MLQKNLPTIPPYLQEKAVAYKRMRAASKKVWPEYEQMLAWLRDRTLTLEAIGGYVGVSRERMRQACNTYFPRVRRVKDRRRFGKRCLESARARREERFKARSKIYALLAKHQKKVAFELEIVWGLDGPLSRAIRYNGRRHYVMLLRSAVLYGAAANYAHALAPTEEATAGCHGLIIILDIDDGFVKASRLYRITLDAFRKKKQSHVLIRIEPRNGHGRKPAIDWNKYLISSLD